MEEGQTTTIELFCHSISSTMECEWRTSSVVACVFFDLRHQILQILRKSCPHLLRVRVLVGTWVHPPLERLLPHPIIESDICDTIFLIEYFLRNISGMNFSKYEPTQLHTAHALRESKRVQIRWSSHDRDPCFCNKKRNSGAQTRRPCRLAVAP